MKIIIQRGPKAIQSMLKESTEANKKRVIGPFAISLSKRQNRGRTPLDAC